MSLERRLPLSAGTIFIAGFFATAHAWKLAPAKYSVVGTWRLPWTVAFVGLILIAAYAVGLPEVPTTRLGALGSAATAIGFGIVGVSLAQLVLGTPLLPRVVLGGVSLCFIPWALLSWNADHDRLRLSSIRAVFIGGAQEYAELQTELADQRVPVKLVDRFDSTAQKNLSGNHLSEELERQEIAMAILDFASMATPAIVSQVALAHRKGLRVRTVSLFAEEFLGKIPLADLERMSLLFDIGEVHRGRYLRWKRVIDATFGILAMFVLVPLGTIIAASALFGDRGPLFYRQPRVGKDGQIFSILKFRSMTDLPNPGTDWTSEDDPRITRVGSFLRRSHLDELPQAWNVLKGDLSIVGPRPEQPHYVAQLAEKIPFYETRHIVRPGLTGWAQVNYSYGANVTDAREKLQYDLYYLRRQSPWLDIQILIRTIRTVIGRTGR